MKMTRCKAQNIVMEVLENWTRPRILPFIALFLLYAFTRPMNYEFLHVPIIIIMIKTSSIWYLVFYVQVIKDMWLPTSSKVKDVGKNDNCVKDRKPKETIINTEVDLNDSTGIHNSNSNILMEIKRTKEYNYVNYTMDEFVSKYAFCNHDPETKDFDKEVAYEVFIIDPPKCRESSTICQENCMLNRDWLENNKKIHENSIKYSREKAMKNSDMCNKKSTHNIESSYHKVNDSHCFINMYAYFRNTYVFKLLGYFSFHRYKNQSESEKEEAYKQFFTLAFVISSMGDAFMIFPSTFVPGVLSYGSAHLLSIIGFQNRFKRPRFSWLVYPYNGIGFLTIVVWVRSIQMALIIFIYTFMLTTVLFYALSNLETRPSARTLLAAIGALFYIWSDTMIAYDKWIFSLPFRDALVWSTYFFAQMNLALSV